MTYTEVRASEIHRGASRPPINHRSLTLVVLFTATAFVGAGLLFVVQPMIARLVLPSFGGSATVWSTSSLFFQLLLLLGYVYAHASTRRLGARWQPPVHLLLLLAPLVVLPIVLPSEAAPSADVSPTLWLLMVLTVMIGLPFFVVSTTGPLLQRWYSWGGGPRAHDPYFLFAASNLGSFGGLLAYPFLAEPFLTLDEQRLWWSWGFVLFVGLVAACAVVTRVSAGHLVISPLAQVNQSVVPSLGLRVTGRWALLAFLPSGLMLAVTAHVTTDVAAIPLLWVIPLAIYLGTFVIAFGRSSRTVPTTMVRLAVASTFLAAAAAMMQARTPVLLDIALNMTMLGLVGFVAHARLAAERPEVGHLTAFYLVIATGGALGGLLNGFVAPLLFDRVLEYPLLAVLTPLVLVASRGPERSVTAQTLRTKWAGRIVAVAVVVSAAVGLGAVLSRWADSLVLALLGLAFAFLAGWLLSTSRVVVTVVLALFFAGLAVYSGQGALEHRRTFYGSYRVLANDDQHQLAHGTTLHGTQWLDERSSDPTTYYARSGPLGTVFELDDIRDVAVVGLGVGTIAAYGVRGQHFNFVEIDPEIVQVARDPSLFTYLRDSRARITTTVGDGRLELAKLPASSLDMVVLDAFNSDSIPVHLLTTEAMGTYAERLRPGGLLVVHISNQVLDLAPVLAGAAEELGWSGRVATGGGGVGSSLSRWVVLSSGSSSLDALTGELGWAPLPERSVRWTDDYSSILSVLR
jgi:hypothetical protein